MCNLDFDCGYRNPICVENPPKWLLLWMGIGEDMRCQRRTWGEDAKYIVDQLVRTGQWLVWRDGDHVECKHRCQVQN